MIAKNRKVLLIVPKFYGYESLIRKELSKSFSEVNIIFENREWVSLWHRFVYVYMPNCKRRVLDRFYIKKIDKMSKDIDVVLVIRGSSLSPKVMEYMKKSFSTDCRYIMYQWDGIKNNPDILECTPFFDDIYTFDIEDSMKYEWSYRPLFFDESKVHDFEKKIDISFLCSLHSQRAQVLEKLKNISKKNGYSFFFHMYCNKFAYYKWKYIGRKPEYRSSKNEDVVFKSLSLEESYELYSKSKVVVDYTHPDQTGYTMRTIEAIGNRCKLITNNRYIKNADFYNPNNIYVYEGTNVDIPNGFVERPYENIDIGLYNYYSLKGWLNTLLGDESYGKHQ